MDFETSLGVFKDSETQAGKKFQTGFYIQRRMDKVFLIVNAGLSDKIIVYRPNVGRRVLTRQYITSRIRYGEYSPVDEAEAKDIWDKEFELADCPFEEGAPLSYIFFFCFIPPLLHTSDINYISCITLHLRIPARLQRPPQHTSCIHRGNCPHSEQSFRKHRQV